MISKKKLSFIIYTFKYDEKSGGVIVLHYLCKLLNNLGYKAQIYLTGKKNDPIMFNNLIGFFSGLISIFPHKLKRTIVRIIFFLLKDTRILEKSTLLKLEKILHNTQYLYLRPNNNTIVVYPEIIGGNPLMAKNVVRWLLNKPGYITSKIDYNKDDLFFYYQEVFNDLNFNPNKNCLTVSYIKSNIYKQYNFKKRTGRCYIIRKGKKRSDLPETFDGPIVDSLPDNELVKIFNQFEYCISYDQYTMYSIYAALCGCISVVMPVKGVTKEEWQPKEEFRYSIAYGLNENEIDFAKKTKYKLEEYLDSIDVENVKQVENFIHICAEYFNIV